MEEKERIVLVDNSNLTLKALEDILGNEYVLFSFAKSKNIIENAAKIAPSLIILDINLPNNGREIVDSLKADSFLSSVPVMFLIEAGDTQNEETSFRLGAVDVITKPFKPNIVQARVSHQINNYLKSTHALLKAECFNTLICQTNKVVFEYDFASSKIQALFNFEAIFGRSSYAKTSETDAIAAKAIHPEDVEAYEKIFTSVRRGINIPGVKIRIKDVTGEYKWCLISAAVIADKNKNICKAIATLEDIDETVRLAIINDKRLSTAITNSKLCMFEYYIDEQRSVCSPITMEIFGTPHIIENAVQSVIEAGIVHSDYVEQFIETYSKISKGSPIERIEFIQYRKDGSEMLVELTLTNVFDAQGRPFVAIGIMRDMTDRLLLMKQAYYDDLTNCRNLIKFKIDAPELLVKNPQLNYMVIKLDIDRFKLLNEVYGYQLCDQLLIEFSKAIESSLDPKCDMHARINSDEFILLIGYENEEMLAKKIENKDKAIDEYLQKLIPDKVNIRKGRYPIEKGETDFNAIFEKVNYAHRYAKKTDELICNYDHEIKNIALRQKEIESKMESALLNGDFKVFLQPKYRIADEIIIGAEALVRWVSKDKDVVYPNSFIPIFEQNGFIIKLDMYMFEQTCKIIRNWLDNNITPVALSVNFSRLHLSDKAFVEKLTAISDKYNVPHNLLEIELTETTIFDNIGILEVVLESLHSHGFTLSMDDFGTGYSSLGLLKSIPVDVIKMDKSFFDDSQDNKRARVVIGSVMEMAKKLDAHTVAEGVESKQNVDMLRRLGCDTVQGYYYAKPMPAEDFTSRISVLSKSFNMGK